MFEELLNKIPNDFLNFILVTLFSLLIGLEQRSKHKKEKFESRFGTDRTFTLIGIFGYILYIIDTSNLYLFAGGGIAVTSLLVTSYWGKIKMYQMFGITSIVIALITYCLAPLIYSQPAWLVILVVVTILWLAELKETLFTFSQKFDDNEFVSLAKFLVIIGVILPLLPDKPISAFINISPYKFWLAIVAVSGISYSSYLLKKFVFPNAGVLLTGVLGGLYSSTATTFILARKSKDEGEKSKVAPAIILATSMMYVRIFLLAVFFNKSIALKLAPSFAICTVVSIAIALYFIKFQEKKGPRENEIRSIQPNNNPLELKTALIFALLFIFFALVTEFVTKNYGAEGIRLLSLLVGVTDIDPFILNLFQSRWNVENTALVSAVLIAVSSNNLLKMIYGSILGDKVIKRQLMLGFGILILLGFLFAFVIPT
jgi:uncharacterized membrane protein (DUF4010 family)